MMLMLLCMLSLSCGSENKSNNQTPDKPINQDIANRMQAAFGNIRGNSNIAAVKKAVYTEIDYIMNAHMKGDEFYLFANNQLYLTLIPTIITILQKNGVAKEKILDTFLEQFDTWLQDHKIKIVDGNNVNTGLFMFVLGIYTYTMLDMLVYPIIDANNYATYATPKDIEITQNLFFDKYFRNLSKDNILNILKAYSAFLSTAQLNDQLTKRAIYSIPLFICSHAIFVLPNSFNEIIKEVSSLPMFTQDSYMAELLSDIKDIYVQKDGIWQDQIDKYGNLFHVNYKNNQNPDDYRGTFELMLAFGGYRTITNDTFKANAFGPMKAIVEAHAQSE